MSLLTFYGHSPLPHSFSLHIAMDTDSNTDIICKLCGAWFETRKGLSSHARAHLRHFGVEYSESKGSPIDLLNTLILTDDFKRRATSFHSDSPEDLRVHEHSMNTAPPSPSTSTPSSASKRPFLSKSVLLKNTSLKSAVGSKATSSSSFSTHTLLSPPTKKLKPSQQVFRLSGRELMSIPLGDLIHYYAFLYADILLSIRVMEQSLFGNKVRGEVLRRSSALNKMGSLYLFYIAFAKLYEIRTE